MSNHLKVFLVALVMVLGPVSAQAMDRYGLVGTSVGMPLNIDPEVKRGDVTYSIDLGYFLAEDWAFILAFGFGLEDEKKIDLTTGIQAFFELDTFVRPYLTGKFLYVLDPEKDMGLRILIGAEWSLRSLTGMDNLQAFTETGVSQILNHGDKLAIELFRAGISWSY